MRLFAAIDLTDAARAAVAAEQTTTIAALGGHVAALKVVRPEHMHLTLAFAGEADQARGAATVCYTQKPAHHTSAQRV
jgi:2'-5' RNA ligase